VSGSAPPAERTSLLEIELGEQPAATPAAPDGGAKPPRKRTDAASVTLQRTARALAREAARADWLWPGLAVAGVACFVVFVAGGGLALSSMTTVEIVLTLGAGAIAAALLLVGPLRARERPPGSLATALLIAFTVLTALSIVWSVAPDASYRDTGRMLAYTAVFGVAVMLARSLPARVTAVIGGATLAAVIVCGYALLTKVFPGQLDASDIYARLRAPYSYWNATGLTAAMGAVGCLWLGARRDGHALLRAAAYPAMGLLLATLLLAYSRGALAALLIGVAIWFWIVPLRLRGASVLIVGALGAAVVVAFAFSTHALSSDSVSLSARTNAGHQLGVLLVVVLVLLAIAGTAIVFQTGRRAPSAATRRRAGQAIVAMLVLAVVAAAGALAVSHRGLTGSISHAVHTLTDPNAPVPANTPGRLTAVASVRARYWNEALEIFQAHPAAGVGAEGYATARLRYRNETLDVRHAHGFVVQTLADLGLVGLVLSVCLFAAWLVSASRSALPLDGRAGALAASLRARVIAAAARRGGVLARVARRERVEAPAPSRGRPYTPERIALLSMFSVVACFGAHSLVDWTWYVPGTAFVALLFAGWLAGRGPLPAREPRALSRGAASRVAPHKRAIEVRRDRRTLVLVGATVLASVLAAWAQWQPQRSESTREQSLALLAAHPAQALKQAREAVSIDPLSVQALFALSRAQLVQGSAQEAHATLAKAVRMQPSDPQTWLELGENDLTSSPRAAVSELSAAIYLDPESIAPELIARGDPEAIRIQNQYVQALRASGGQ
jgi:O-antigen ligase